MTERWSEKTRDLVAAAIVDHAWITETDCDRIAELALAALANAGLLVEPGSETRLKAAETVCVLYGWCAARQDSDREKAALQAYAEEHATKRDITVPELLRRGLLWLTTDPWNKALIEAGLAEGLSLEQISADMHRSIDAAFDGVTLEEREAQLREFDDGGTA